MFRLFIKNCNVDKSGSVAMWQHMFVFMWCVLRCGVSCSSHRNAERVDCNLCWVVLQLGLGVWTATCARWSYS